MNRGLPIFALFCACASQPSHPITEAAPPAMSVGSLGEALEAIDPATAGAPGNWSLTYQGVKLTCLAQEDVDRMRIFVPIAKLEDVSDRQLSRTMEANFQGALDARYATSRGMLFSVYVHPLSTLDRASLISAIHQVASLAATFGTAYTSGATAF